MVRGYRGASFDSSELTWRESAEFSSEEEEEETSSFVYSAEKEKVSTEWTDEKHSLYLKSMEASFVHQLYNSLGNLGSRRNKNATDIGSSSSVDPPSQDQVHGSGFWSEHCFNGSDPCHFGPLAEGRSQDWWPMLEGSYVPKSRAVCPNTKKGTVICGSGSVSASKQVRSGHGRDQFNDIEEVSDQNFVDEGDGNREEPNSPSSSKKMKIGTNESAGVEVVPYRKARRTR